MEQSVSQKIVRNTIFNTIGRVWGILVALILTPYIIHHIGVERYGIWAIIGVLTGYFGLLDFGIGGSFVKYISEFYAKGEREKINQVVNTGFVFYSLFAILISVLAFLLINPLLAFFKISQDLHSEAEFVFLLGIILFGVSNGLSPFGAIQGGLQRMDISNKVAMAMSIPSIAGTIFFLENGYGLPGLMINNGIILAVSGTINIIVAFKILPHLRITLKSFNRGMLKRLFGFGYKLQAVKIATMIQFHADKIILAYFLGVGFVTYYAVAAQLALKAREIPLMLISAILPAASELEAKSDKRSLQKLYFRSSRFIVLAGLPISFLVVILAEPFINLWLGPGYKVSVVSLQVLMFPYFLTALTGPGVFILSGMGKPQYAMRCALLAMSLSIVLNIPLTIKIGFFGVIIGTSISMSIGAAYFVYTFHKVTNIPLFQTYRKIFSKPAIAVLATYLVTHFAKHSTMTWIDLVSFGFFNLAAFFAILWITRYFDRDDIMLIKNIITLKSLKNERN